MYLYCGELCSIIYLMQYYTCEENQMNIRIESSSNSVCKHVKKLQTRSGRTKSGQYLAEGMRAVTDAIANGADVEYVIVSEGFSPDFDTSKLKVYEMSTALFNELKLTVNSQGVLAVINYHLLSAADLDPTAAGTVVYLDSVTDPGNMGTIIRSCDALGADAIIVSKGCVDIFNPKVVRSTMASLLNVPIYTDDIPGSVIPKLAREGFMIAGTFPQAAEPCFSQDYSGKVVLVMGNEANGIRNEISALCTHRITIPMLGRAESLNVATALTVMLYEIMRSKMINRGDT